MIFRPMAAILENKMAAKMAIFTLSGKKFAEEITGHTRASDSSF